MVCRLFDLPSPVLAASVSFLSVRDHMLVATVSRQLLAACRQRNSWPSSVHFLGCWPAAGWPSKWGCHPQHLVLSEHPVVFEGALSVLRSMAPRLRSLRFVEPGADCSHGLGRVGLSDITDRDWNEQNFPCLERLDLMHSLSRSFIRSKAAVALPALAELTLRQRSHTEPAFVWDRARLPSLHSLHLDQDRLRLHESFFPILRSLRLTSQEWWDATAPLLSARCKPQLQRLAIRFQHGLDGDFSLVRTIILLAFFHADTDVRTTLPLVSQSGLLADKAELHVE